MRHGLLLGLLLLVCGSCSDGQGVLRGSRERPAAFRELSRLAFVPAGTWQLQGFAQLGMKQDLFVDRFEVTRRLWKQWAEGDPELEAVSERWQEGEPDLPATHCTLLEAERWASRRQMTIPTVDQWMFIAVGPEGQSWPWGNVGRASSTNDSRLKLQRILPVGTFESGANPQGIYDLVGNVWEWARGPLPWRTSGYGDNKTTVRVQSFEYRMRGGDPITEQQLMGGSYLWPAQALWAERSFFASSEGSEYHAGDAGFRCVVEARTYLERRAQEWSRPALRPALVEAGRRWGSGLRPLLLELLESKEAPEAVAWILEGINQ